MKTKEISLFSFLSEKITSRVPFPRELEACLLSRPYAAPLIAQRLEPKNISQADMAFTPGVLAFTRVVTADRIGEQVGSGAVSTQPGQILDADIYFNPADPNTTFATPAALTAHPKSYDLESILTYELGHFLGFSHSAVWSATMFPYAHVPGTYAMPRPATQRPDAPLSEDDRVGLRVLYPDLSDSLHIGSIQGRILPANPLSLPASPPGVTGIFGAQVVAIDTATGAIAAATIAGWSCSSPGPAQFDGSYRIERLTVGHSYQVYAEPLNGVVAPSQIGNALAMLCRNATPRRRLACACHLRCSACEHSFHGAHTTRPLSF